MKKQQPKQQQKQQSSKIRPLDANELAQVVGGQSVDGVKDHSI